MFKKLIGMMRQRKEKIDSELSQAAMLIGELPQPEDAVAMQYREARIIALRDLENKVAQ